MEFLVLWIICGIITGVIASNKGRSGFGWFLIGSLLGIFGVILIACLPSLKPQPVQIAPGSSETAPLTRRLKVCPDCAEEVQADARICKHCRHEFAPAPAPTIRDRPSRWNERSR
ncbi:MAG: hypothetical protein WA975_05075 [Mesorhizobium sp.]